MNQHTRQALALAGLAQAAYLTYQVANHGTLAQDKFHTCVDSLFVMEAESTEAVYGGIGKLSLGMEVIKELLEGGDSLMKSPDILRYIMSILHLEARLQSGNRMMTAIVNGLEEIARFYASAEDRHGKACILRIGGLYQNTISTLRQRIQVKGNYQFLNDDYNAARIRVLLLAGIRSAVLWRQLGGRRWLLIFRRAQLKRDVNQLLEIARAQQNLH